MALFTHLRRAILPVSLSLMLGACISTDVLVPNAHPINGIHQYRVGKMTWKKTADLKVLHSCQTRVGQGCETSNGDGPSVYDDSDAIKLYDAFNAELIKRVYAVLPAASGDARYASKVSLTFLPAWIGSTALGGKRMAVEVTLQSDQETLWNEALEVHGPFSDSDQDLINSFSQKVLEDINAAGIDLHK